MGLITVNGQADRLTNSLNPFQLELQVHLPLWKPWLFRRGFKNCLVCRMLNPDDGSPN